MILGLVPPSRVREGVVTDSSIELLWDPAQGRAHSYEVICLNCDHSRMVNKTNNPLKIRCFHLSFLGLYLISQSTC